MSTDTIAPESASPATSAPSGTATIPENEGFDDDAFLAGKYSVTDETPGSTDSAASDPAPAPSASEAQPTTQAATPEQPAAPDDGSTVTFTKRDGSTVTFRKGTKAAQAAADAVLAGQDIDGIAPESAESVAAQPEQNASAPVTTAPASEQATPALTYTSDGETFELKGWTTDEKGNVIVPAQHKDEVLRHLSIATHHQRTFRAQIDAVKQENARIRAQYADAVSQEKAVSDAMLSELTAITSDPSLLSEALQNPGGLRGHLARVSADAEKDWKLAQVEREKLASASVDPGQEQRELVEAFDSALGAMRGHDRYGAILSGPHGPAIVADLESVAKMFVQETKDGKVYNTDAMAAFALREHQRRETHAQELSVLQEKLKAAEVRAQKAIEAGNRAAAFNVAQARATQPGTPQSAPAGKKKVPEVWDDDAFLRGEYT